MCFCITHPLVIMISLPLIDSPYRSMHSSKSVLVEPQAASVSHGVRTGNTAFEPYTRATPPQHTNVAWIVS